ncbi:DUF4132 domain-containing protein [Saccharothrix texasensis]|uniref:DUF4132 domain-containing protein n=1 Tax=Saccharothrix texasensis TaxID=103734 RepID=UPI0011CD6767|nr:DUF4132 domain-containing protein [Saccharothrix texasensis]
MRRWELVSGGSAKFWEVDRAGVTVTVRFGRLGANGQTQTKDLASAEAAEAHVAKLVAEKEKKGYRATGSPGVAREPGTTTTDPTAADRPASPSPAAAAPTSSSAALPATTPASQPTGSAAAEPAAPAVVDEDTWVMPKAWLREVVRQRGFHPAPVFAVDAGSAARGRGAVDQATLDRVLSAPESDPELVRAVREHLAGRPDPVGAAAVAIVTKHLVPCFHAWLVDHGLAFAVEAVIESLSIDCSRRWRPREQDWTGVHLHRHNATNINPGDSTGLLLTTVRYAIAVADETEREAAEAVLARQRAHTVVRAYLMPERADWFDEACRVPQRSPRWWMLPCTANTPEQFEQAQVSLNDGAFLLHTALYVLGPAVAPLLAAALDHQDQRAERRKLVLKILAALPTDEAFTVLLDRLDTQHVRPALLAAMSAFPARAARLLAAREPGNAEVRQLLSVHLMTHSHLAKPEGFTAVELTAVPEAPEADLPPLLASPPWLRRKPPVAPVVVPDLPVPDPSVVWRPGEREQWLTDGHWDAQRRQNWRHWLAEYHAGRIGYRMIDLLISAPEAEVRPLLADWEPNLDWNAESAGKRLAAKFGFDALPALVRVVRGNSGAAVVVLPFATPEVAALMADWLVRLKQVRGVALEWLARHRETAARFLIPAALGKPGAGRRNAETALRHLHAVGVDVAALAPTADAGAALRTFLAVDPVDVLPAKLPVIAEWADTRLLPRVLLRDRRQGLSPAAAKNLLIMAALSKPNDVYAGLPVVREALDRASLAEFAWAVHLRWHEAGAPSKDSWALTALGWFGDDSTVRALSPLIRAWPGESQHARAVTGLDVLADIGTEVALSHLNGIAEKAKFRGLKLKAQEKVSRIAAELGLSRDQLADRLVPRLGLDDAASLVVDYGPRRFTVGFDEQLKPYVLDPDGKRRKDLPKPGAKDDQDLAPLEHKRFAALKKDVRTIASDQIQRLERAMVDQRTWTAEEFRAVLAAHPLLWHLVRRLVWITDEGVSFRLAEDRTLADSADDEFALPDDATVRVAHPVDLRDTAAVWGEVFADYEILQPFPQLGRPVHLLESADGLLPRLKEYCATPYPIGKILGLTKKGWVRGTPQDAGVECWITRPFPAGGALVASLDPGIAVGAMDVFPEVGFRDVWFSPSGHGDWSAPGNAPTTYEIDPITCSELLAELEALRS